MRHAALQVGGYGIITLLGGIHGYLSKGSVPSLAAGTLLGILLLAGARGMRRKAPWGWWISALAVVLLVGRFAPAFTRSGQIYPHGMMAALGIWVIGVLLIDALREPPAFPSGKS